MNDTIESLRARLMKCERERDAAYRKLDSLGHTFLKYEETQAMLEATVKGVEAERDAACAEMRAALEVWHGPVNPPDSVEHCPTCALLARTDLGRGMVAVPREVVERMLRGATTGFSMSSAGDSAWERLASDLDALLDGGKERG